MRGGSSTWPACSSSLPRPITLLTGNDNFILESFMLGATGALIGFGAVMTREQVDMIDAWQDGRTEDGEGPRSPCPAPGRRRVRRAGRRLPGPAQGVPAHPRRARERARPRARSCRSSDAERAHLADVLREVGLLDRARACSRLV